MTFVNCLRFAVLISCIEFFIHFNFLNCSYVRSSVNIYSSREAIHIWTDYLISCASCHIRCRSSMNSCSVSLHIDQGATTCKSGQGEKECSAEDGVAIKQGGNEDIELTAERFVRFYAVVCSSFDVA